MARDRAIASSRVSALPRAGSNRTACLYAHIYWISKQSLFRGPLGPVMRWPGGIAVKRETGGNVLAATAPAIVAADGALQLMVSPEGTRGKARHWRTGLHFIARQAKVPIVPACTDHRRTVGGLGTKFAPAGDIAADMAVIKRFHAGMQGRRADSFENDRACCPPSTTMSLSIFLLLATACSGRGVEARPSGPVGGPVGARSTRAMASPR